MQWKQAIRLGACLRKLVVFFEQVQNAPVLRHWLSHLEPESWGPLKHLLLPFLASFEHFSKHRERAIWLLLTLSDLLAYQVLVSNLFNRLIEDLIQRLRFVCTILALSSIVILAQRQNWWKILHPTVDWVVWKVFPCWPTYHLFKFKLIDRDLLLIMSKLLKRTSWIDRSNFLDVEIELISELLDGLDSVHWKWVLQWHKVQYW